MASGANPWADARLCLLRSLPWPCEAERLLTARTAERGLVACRCDGDAALASDTNNFFYSSDFTFVALLRI